jgi:hypothetical protein
MKQQLPKGNGTQTDHKHVAKPHPTTERDQRLEIAGRRNR